ncbi:MAG: BspA family leucine-rich repeat surface protein, partial [Clostridia bacterium]|nr:BspA family leucine-rich repeat surface protein [Clostridia bacterium]
DLSSFDTTNVLAMNQMFYGFKSLEVLDLTNFNVRSNASITNMFYGCTNLTTIYCGYSWSLSSNAAIFQNCTNLVGGNGTAFSQRKITSSAYAKMDGVGSLGYFTQKNPTIEIRGNCSFTLTNTIVSKRQSVRDTKMYFLVSFSGAGSVPAQDMNRQPVESNGDMLLFELSNGESVTINHLVNSQNPIVQILYDYNGTDPTYWTNGFRQKIGSYGMAALGGARISNFNTSDYDLFAYDQLNKGNVSSSDVATVSINRSTARIANGFGLPAVAFTANFPNVVMSNLMVDDSEEDEPDKEWITYSSLDQNDQGEDICEIDKNAGENEWTYTFKGLDPRLVFYAWEDTVGLDDYVISNTEDNVVKAVGGIATITNTSKTDPPTYGDLKITKSVEPDHASITITNEDKQKLFRFKVTLKDAEGKPLSGLRIYGNTVFQNGVGTALLSHGQSVEFNDIPTGYRYSVEEIEEDGFYNLSDNETGVIAADQTSTAAFFNVKTYVEPEPADTTSFKLRKKLVGNFQDSSAPFDFEVMFEGLESGKSYVIKVESSDVPYKEVSYTSDAYGSALVDLQLPHGSEAKFADIPLGSRYKIEEAAGEYTSSYRITDSQENVENRGSTIVKTDQSNSAENKALATAWETADKDEVITVLYTNRKYAREDLVVRKEIENSSSSNSDVFEFNILLSNLNANELIKTSVGKQKADSEGQLSIQFFMSNGDETLFYDLPVGTKYTVTESQSNYVASYRISDENSLGKIVSQTGENVLDKTDLSTEEETVDEGESAVVTFVNKKVTRDVKITNVVDALYSEIPSEVYKNQDFGFKMEMSGLDHNTKYVAEYTDEAVSGKTESSYYSDDNGKLTVEFTLKDGHSINFINLPKGANYQITEYAAEDYVSSYSTKLSSKAHAAMEQSENTLKNTELKTEVETVDADETYDDMEVTFIFKNTVPITHYVLPDSGMKNRIPLMTGAAFGCIFFAAVYLYQCMKRRSSV